MTAPRVVLHIGLHKTATRFLRRPVFASPDPNRFLFNPEPLFHDLRQVVRQAGDPARIERASEAARQAIASTES